MIAFFFLYWWLREENGKLLHLGKLESKLDDLGKTQEIADLLQFLKCRILIFSNLALFITIWNIINQFLWFHFNLKMSRSHSLWSSYVKHIKYIFKLNSKWAKRDLPDIIFETPLFNKCGFITDRFSHMANGINLTTSTNQVHPNLEFCSNWVSCQILHFNFLLLS